MGCKCIECKYNGVVRDNHDDLHAICVCAESEKFLKEISFAWDECGHGEAETEDEGC